MKPEDDGIDPTVEAQAWLDGLTGRASDSPAAQEGARLREALQPASQEAGIAKPSWAHIAAAARQPSDAHRMTAEPANATHWSLRRIGGLAALVLAGVGVGLLTQSMNEGREPQLRGAPASQAAIWRTADPLRDATQLAARLEAAGAVVAVETPADAVRLTVSCAPERCRAVDAVLAPLDLAVDASGKLEFSALPMR